MKVLILLLTIFVSLATSSPWTSNNQKWNINFNPSHQPQEFFGRKPSINYTYYPSPVDWRVESIYQVLTDRYSDGDPTNNVGTNFAFDGYDLRYVNTRHGGDFKGLMNKLHYIKALGYSSVWISPIFQNMENSYHGYAQIDFTLLDDRFGTLQDFQAFVRKAHQLGLKVIVDIVVNHMADLFYFDGYQGKPDTPFHMHYNEYRMYPHRNGRQYTDFAVNNQYDTDGRYGSIYDDRGQRIDDSGVPTGSFWYSDFHHNGDLRDYGYSNPWNNHLGKIYGLMDDLRTTHPRVAAKLIAMTKSLITSTDIDGIRVDTPMQVPLSFFQAWVPAIREHAKQLGKNNFGVFGEFYCTRERGSTMTGRGISKDFDASGHVINRKLIGNDRQSTMDGGIHYPLYFWFIESVKEQKHNLNGLMTLFQSDRQDYDFYNPRSNWEWQYRNLHFFNNHDQWRMSTDSVDGLAKTMLSSAIIAFWPGIPLFYYGDEQGFNTPGTALDGWAREDFMTSLAWRHPSDQCGGRSVNPATGDSFDMTNQYFLHVQKVMMIRRKYSALNKCDNVVERWHQGIIILYINILIVENFHNGIYGFTRGCTDKSMVLVLFNTWSQPLTIPANAMFTGFQSAGGELWNVMGEYSNKDSLPSERYFLTSTGRLSQSLTLQGYEVKVMIRSTDFVHVDPRVVSISPSHDQVISNSNNIPIQIRFNTKISIQSLKQGVTFNGRLLQSVDPNFSYDEETNTLNFVITNSSLGINIVAVKPKVKSAQGIPLHGEFKSRIRVGNLKDNILLNGCLNFQFQDSLILSAEWSASTFLPLVNQHPAEPNTQHPILTCMKDSGVRGSTGWFDQPYHYLETNKIHFRLRHKAFGASKVRIRLGLVGSDTSFPKSNNDFKIVQLIDRNLTTPNAQMGSLGNALNSGKPFLKSLDGIWSEWIDFEPETMHSVSAQWLVDNDFCNYRVGKLVDLSQVQFGFDQRQVLITIQYYAKGSSSYLLYAKTYI